MTGDSLKKVKAGDRLRIPANAYNAFVDAAQAHRGRQHETGRDSVPQPYQAGVVSIRNDSGADRERFDILSISGTLITPTENDDAFKGRPFLTGALPADAYKGRFAVLLDAIPTGEIGRACVSGVCVVQVEMGNEDHAFAEAKIGDATMLQSAVGGAAKLLWIEPVGERTIGNIAWTVIQIGLSSIIVNRRAIVEPVGPGGQSQDPDFTDQRYWVRFAECTNTDPDAALALAAYGAPPSPEIVMATNLAEDVQASHYLRVGQPVDVWEEVDLTTSPHQRRYYFTLMPWLIVAMLGGTMTSIGARPALAMAAMYADKFLISEYESDPPDTGGVIRGHVLYDGDLYAIGEFELADTTQAVVIKWDGINRRWIDVPGHEIANPYDILVWNNDLYICGIPATGKGNGPKAVWKYNGSNWQSLDFDWNAWGYCLKVWDDGGGEALYAGGYFVGSISFKGVAKWNGTAWVGLNGSLTHSIGATIVNALEIHDAGGGAALYAAGFFDAANGSTTATANVARWNGVVWRAVGDGLPVESVPDGQVYALCSFEDDDGRQLYAGGDGIVDAKPLIAFDGSAWNPRGEALGQVFDPAARVAIRALVAHGNELAVGGWFHNRKQPEGPAEIKHIAAYSASGNAYVGVGDGLNAAPLALAFWGGKLAAGGLFQFSNQTATPYFAVYTASAGELTALGEFGDVVRALAPFGSDLLAGGDFLTIDGNQADHAGIHNGTSWSSPGSFNGPVHCIHADNANGISFWGGHFDIGGGAAAFCLTSWDRSLWRRIITYMEDDEFDYPVVKAVLRVGNILYVGGRFSLVATAGTPGGLPVKNICKIDLSSWPTVGAVTALDDGTDEGVDGEVRQIVAFDGKITISGTFTSLGGGTASKPIVHWDNSASAWTLEGGYWDGPVSALCVFDEPADDDGPGTETLLAAAYGRELAGDQMRYKVRKKASGSWSVLASIAGELNGEVLTIAYGSAGAGDAPYIGGGFDQIGEVTGQTNIPEMSLAFYRNGHYRHAAGGVGVNPNPGPLSLNSGEVWDLRSIQMLGDNCKTLFLGGDFGMVSEDYSPGTAILTLRGMRRMQGGIYGGNVNIFAGAWGFYRIGSGEVLLVGNFTSARNERIREQDVATVSKIVSCDGVVRWDGEYFHDFGGADGLLGKGDAIAKYLGDYYACGLNVVLKTYDPGLETWGIVDAAFIAWQEYACLEVFGGLLWVGGTNGIVSGAAVATWDGTTAAGQHPANFYKAHDFLIADMGGGDELYVAGETDGSKHPLRKRSGGGWVDVGSGITGTGYSVALVDWGGAIGKRIYLAGILTVGSTYCDLAEFDGSSWTAIGTSSALGGIDAIQGPIEGWEPLRLLIIGNFSWLKKIGDPDLTMMANMGQYTAGGGFAPLAAGGLNCFGNELG